MSSLQVGLIETLVNWMLLQKMMTNGLMLSVTSRVIPSQIFL